jgi:hypothetical protein
MKNPPGGGFFYVIGIIDVADKQLIFIVYQ